VLAIPRRPVLATGLPRVALTGQCYTRPPGFGHRSFLEITLVSPLLLIAAALQALAVTYGLVLLSRRQGATGAWLFLLGAMFSMLVWRVVVVTGLKPPAFFNPLIAIWGSTCMVGAMFLFGREVTMRRRVEGERDALLASERAARADAERASRLKDEFLATVSHELRTPLTAIIGWCSVMRHARAPEQTERAVETIERNARVQARLIDDLLDVTRMQAGTLQLDLATVGLGAPVRAAVQAVRPVADAKGVSIELRCGEDTPHVRGDLGRLEQVASNLIVNAVKFTPSGGRVTVIVDTTSDQRARLVVEDTGEGIEADFMPNLFGRFRQADSSPARRHRGLGLGLSIVSTLVRLHGGHVSATSSGRGRGATFTVTLPLVFAPPQASGAAADPGAPPGEAVSVALVSGVRIVLVEDEEDVRAAIARILEQRGASVVALSSGAGIEAALRRHQPHVLLLDISMPDEDGYALIRRVRALPPAAGGATPAISLTAHARLEDRARALSAGFQEHLPKPVDVPVLVAAILKMARAMPAPTSKTPELTS
jgi:signal transduction histidine kinase/CheY-like chemotaxis protein